MKAKQMNRLLSMLLAFTLVLGLVVPAAASNPDDGVIDVQFEKAENAPVPEMQTNQVQEPETPAPMYEDTDQVRVSIFLDRASTLDAGYSTLGISENESAMSYRRQLLQAQEAVRRDIEAVTGNALDVVWNLTLAANAISANVAFGDIRSIEALPEVERVVLETRYIPQSVDVSGELEPNMAVSAQMTGTSIAWKSGFSGAGSRIAIIDTGLDVNHQSVDNDAFLYALQQNAAAEGMSYEDYVASLDLLDEEEIAEKLPLLNIAKAWEMNPENSAPLTADQLYLTEKLPLGFCYVDQGLGISHEFDSNSEHGSHVTGIAAANRYIENADGTFSDAGEAVGLVGNAPDAQVLVMKVFGINGGAYDADYLAAIEDAIVLGCDSVNLSLGSAMPGMSVYPDGYGPVLETMKDSDTVVCISMGNNGVWGENVANVPHLPYVDHQNFFSGGSPGSFESPLTIGSVDNDGIVGHCFQIAGSKYTFSETPTSEFGRQPFLSLETSEDGSGTSYGYVFLDAMGNPEDFEGIDCTNQIVFLSRGEIPFTDKAANAVAAGAAATIIYNNEPGAIGMNLDMYFENQPVVSILKVDADAIRAASTEAVTEAGVPYYTGTFFIDASTASTYYDSEYLNMSLFSSWGAPGNLSLKPEIVAPGGNIYSMNGTHMGPDGELAGGTSSYELMSGTSMAAPQMSGISALVLQAIAERGISVDGLTNRALAQSLMMSTARPMVDANGAYYPLIQQGAGVVDTAAAVGADSYVLVEGQDDGKVKAELGDDPERTGEYTFTFTLNNLDGVARTYNLAADVFGQEAVVAPASHLEEYAEEPAAFVGNGTIPFLADVTFYANGQEIQSLNAGLDSCDFNGDGIVNPADGQALLDLAVGTRESVENADFADLNGDGRINTYDAHAFLKLLSTATGVEVPAGESVEITASISLTEDMKQALSDFFTTGNFVYAYVYAIPEATAEGAYGTIHSIPMLAYFGRWSDNSLFDVGTYAEHSTGDEIRDTYFNNRGINSFAVAYGDRPDGLYYFGGNPIQPDSSYKPERNAINAARGDLISQINISPIRNGADSRFVVRHDGEILQATTLDSIPGAFFYWGSGSWQNTVIQNRLDWVPEAAGLQEGDEFELSFEMATEYDLNPNFTVRWDELGAGSRITVPGVVDNTAPVIDAVKLDLVNNTLIVTATDNQYVSGAILNNITGTEAISQVGANQEALAGETHDFVLDLDGVNGKKFLLQVADYAANVSTYELNVQIGEDLPLPEMMIFSADSNAWVSDDYYCESGDYNPELYRVLAALDRTMSAATVIEDHVYSVSTDNQLFVAPLDEMNLITYVAQLPYGIADMTLNRQDNTIYAVNENNDLVTIDPMNGECAVVAHIGIPTDALTCDDQGTFYCVSTESPEVASNVDTYRFTLETAEQPELFLNSNLANKPSGGEITESMEWNPNDGMIYWYGCYRFSYMNQPGGYGFLFRMNPNFDPDTATEPPYTRYDQGGIRTGAMIIINQDNVPGGNTPVDDVQLSTTEANLHRGLDIQLSAAVRPWNVHDRTVAWTTSDPAVATVDEAGHVIAVDVGTAVITATSNQDPTKSAACTVSVDTIDLSMKGVLKNADGQHQLFSWDLTESAQWVGGAAVDAEVCSVAYDGADRLYINNALNDAGNLMVLDEATGELLQTLDSMSGAPLWDMAYCDYDSNPHLAGVYRWLAFIPGNPAPESFFDLTGNTAPLFGIVCRGVEEIVDMDNQPQTALHLTMLDGDRNIVDLWAFDSPQGPQGILDITPTDLDVRFKIFDGVNKRSSLVTDQYGNLFLSYYNPELNQNDIYVLTYDAENTIYHSELVTHMGEHVWPAALYEVVSGEAFAPADPMIPSADAQAVSAISLTGEELAARIAEMDARTYETPAAESDDDPIDGSLNAVASQPSVEDDNLVTVTVSADNATTNGLITVDYDADELAFVTGSSRASLHALAAEDGQIRLAYAYAAAVPADTELLTLRFERLTNAGAEITVTVAEENDQEPNRSETVVLTGLTGWVESDGSWYYYDENSQPVTGWQWIYGFWFYFDENGVMQTSWQWIDGIWYFFDGAGHMKTGWQYIDVNGVMQTGYREENGSWYYMDGAGHMQTGWIWLDGVWFYLDGAGHMQTGWVWLDGYWYYMDAAGHMQTGWQWIDGEWYYFYGNGTMAANMTVQGCRLGSSGAMIH